MKEVIVQELANDGLANSFNPVMGWDGGPGSNLQVGGIYLANDSRFIESHFSVPLTAYAVGWKDPSNIEATLEFIAPKVSVGRRFEFAAFTNAEEFLTEVDDVRAIYGEFKRVQFSSRKVTARTLNKGLTMRIDVDAMGETVENWREVCTGKLMRRLLRNELLRGITALTAAASASTATWNAATGGSQDPDRDVRTIVDGYGDVVGVQPNRALYGRKALTWRRNTYGAMNAPAGYAGYVGMSPEQIADSIGVEQVLISNERYTTAPTTKAQAVGSNVLVFLAESGQTPEDASNIKRFVSPTAGGTPFRVYEQQINSKLFDLTVEHFSQIVITGAIGIQKLSITTG